MCPFVCPSPLEGDGGGDGEGGQKGGGVGGAIERGEFHRWNAWVEILFRATPGHPASINYNGWRMHWIMHTW